MNQKFEYYIKKMVNKIILQLITFILLTAILIIIAIVLEFKIANIFLPVVYILIGLFLLYCIICNYLIYRKHMFLLNNYTKIEKEEIIQRITNLKKSAKGFFMFLYYLNVNSYRLFDEAITAIDEIN